MQITPEQIASQFADISKQLAGMEGRLTGHVDKQLAAAVKELKHQAQIYKEELKEEVKLGAEGYGATLEGIQRELADLNKKVDTTLGDHDRVLTDHSKRIITLEGR